MDKQKLAFGNWYIKHFGFFDGGKQEDVAWEAWQAALSQPAGEPVGRDPWIKCKRCGEPRAKGPMMCFGGHYHDYPAPAQDGDEECEHLHKTIELLTKQLIKTERELRAAQACKVPEEVTEADAPAFIWEEAERRKWATGWNQCRRAMLAAAPEVDNAEGQQAV